MDIMTRVFDNRINSWNLFVETTFKEYLSFAREIISNNDLQRKRVKTSKTVYSLLKMDLKKGCIIPPLVLAVSKDDSIDPENITSAELLTYIKNNNTNVMILDGLQRTYTLIDADEEMKMEDNYEEFLDNKLRLEVYVEINKFGVLYRMLTLNTGQTPMSARHQIEMLYRNLLNTEVDGINIISDTQGKANPDDNAFSFKNLIDGFNSYMSRSELPIDRQDLLENIKFLENMSGENVSNDLFAEFLNVYSEVFKTLRTITNDYMITGEDIYESELSDSPFAKKVSKAFSTSQALTGFGAAVGKMKDKELINDINDIKSIMKELSEKNSDYQWFINMLRKLDIIKFTSKKIGNAQRMFFQYFFRDLLNSENDSYLNLELAVESAYNKYNSQVM